MILNAFFSFYTCKNKIMSALLEFLKFAKVVKKEEKKIEELEGK